MGRGGGGGVVPVPDSIELNSDTCKSAEVPHSSSNDYPISHPLRRHVTPVTEHPTLDGWVISVDLPCINESGNKITRKQWQSGHQRHDTRLISTRHFQSASLALSIRIRLVPTTTTLPLIREFPSADRAGPFGVAVPMARSDRLGRSMFLGLVKGLLGPAQLRGRTSRLCGRSPGCTQTALSGGPVFRGHSVPGTRVFQKPVGHQQRV